MYVEHKKGNDIVQTYNRLHNWLQDSNYQPLREDGVMPIKHELYLVDRDPNDHQFDILIPVVKES